MHLIQVNLMVEDFPAMLAFYRDKLGFSVIEIDPGPPCKPLENWASLDARGAIIELFDVDTFGDRSALRGSNRTATRLSLLVDDVDKERAQLVERGISCDEAVSERWGRYSGFCDPEGNQLQLTQVFDTGH